MSKPLFNVPGHQLHGLLAKGGMAEVYLAEQQSLGRKVALKILDKSSGDPDFIERFLKEARLVATLHHPGIITIYDFGILEDKRLFLSMEFMEGGDLDTKLANGITEAEALRILKELVKALVFIHSKAIVHRDIKPANILFRHDGTLVLTDFGIAKDKADDVKLTQAGTMVGSPAYCSPEQAQGLDVDSRSDIYSTGVLFVEMLLGRNPYKADSFVSTSINHIQMDIPQLPGSLDRFQDLIEKMLAKHPQDRFHSAEALLAFLEDSENYYSAHTSTPAQKFFHFVETEVYPRLKQFKHYLLTTVYPFVKKVIIYLLKNAYAYTKQFIYFCQTTVYPLLKKLTIYLVTNLIAYTKRFINYCQTVVFPFIKRTITSLMARIAEKKN